MWLAPRMQQLYSRFPDTEFRLSSFNWEIEDENTSCDIEIRFGDPDNVQNGAVKLFDEKVFPVCSPELLQQMELNQPKDLENSLLFEVFGNRVNWASWFDQANIAFTPNFKVQRVDSANLAYASVVNGFGVALGWKSLVSHQLETKQLIEPFNIRADTSQGFYALQSPGPNNREISSQVIDWIVQQV